MTQLDPHSHDAMIAALPLETKVEMLTGADFWSTVAVPALGLRSMVFSDGPSGVRGEVWDERFPSLCLPSGTALAATWDIALAEIYGAVLAGEAARKGIDVVLGPTINIQRTPYSGRHFEMFSEDPLLVGEIASAYISGLQRCGIAGCPKHFVANDSETDRFTIDVRVDDRALHEIYLAPFERVSGEGGAWSLMSAYNAVDGTTMSESPLLQSPLKSKWGFDGVVVSDWGGVRSLASASSGQDLSMPGPGGPWGTELVAAVQSGAVSIEVIDAKVRRLLRLAERVGALGDGKVHPVSRLDAAGFAREVSARSMVLLRNNGALPLRSPQRIAVFGQSAVSTRIQGGGSATVVPASVVSPLEGLVSRYPDISVDYSMGATVLDGISEVPLSRMRHPDSGETSLRVRFLDERGTVVEEETRYSTALTWFGTAPTDRATVLELSLDYVADTDDTIEFGIAAVGCSEITMDGVVILDVDQRVEGMDLGASILAPPFDSARVEVVAGRRHRVDVRYHIEPLEMYPGTLAVTFGTRPAARSDASLIEDAVRLARESDVSIVVVGTNSSVESEGFDRHSLALPGSQDDLIEAVAAASRTTIVVINSGAPVVMPWRDRVDGIVVGWFAGQEGGNALADILSGDVEPGGRLPTSWPATETDVPVSDVAPVDGALHYTEGIHVGYRAWHRAGVAPAFPFGSGVGYTSWGEPSLALAAAGANGIHLDVARANTGPRTGRSIVQLYLSRGESAIDRPTRWLAGFAVLEAEPGTTARTRVHVGRRAFEHWSTEHNNWRIEAGEFELSYGENADEMIDGVTLTIDADATLHALTIGSE